MSWFRRNKGDESSPVDEEQESSPAATAATVPVDPDGPPAESDGAAEVYDRSQGPWDLAEVDPEADYIDLGAIRLPAKEGTLQMRLEIEEQTNKVIAATLAGPDGTMQLGVFAAPRNEGIWDEVRAEIAESLRGQRRPVPSEKDGPFGTELHGTIPSDAGGSTVPVRFVGVDGPRWFLRALFHGAAALDVDKALELESLVRDVVVVRGTEAMAPRELLPLRLPDGAQGAEGEGAEGAADDGLRPPERGPEITEVR